MKRIFLLLLMVAALSVFMCMTVFGEEAMALDTGVENRGFSSSDLLFDGSRSTYAVADGEGMLTLTGTEGAVHLYIEFDLMPDPWTLTDPATGKSVTVGEDGFLHEYINISEVLGAGVSSLELRFPSGTSIADIYLYSEGELPAHVQTWAEPLSCADIMLVSSHSDDEQLFFAL